MPDAVRRLALAALVALGLASLVLFGIVGKGRGDGPPNFDGAVLYAAGRAWLAHENPYDHDALMRSVRDVPEIDLSVVYFFYPPQTAALCLPLGLLPYLPARLLWLSVNLGAIAAMVAYCLAALRRAGPKQFDETGAWVLAAVVIGNPFATHVVWMGQTPLVAGAAVMGAWYFARERPVLAGVCLGLATFKPQLCLLVLVWFLLERQWKIVLVAMLTAALMAAYPAAEEGPVGALRAWKGGIDQYKSLEFNVPGFQHNVGLQSLLEAAGLRDVPGFTVVGLALTGLLWYYRRHVREEDVLGLLMVLTFTFVGFSHDYDYVCLVPLWVSLWLRGRERPAYGAAFAVLMLLLFFPQRVVRDLHSPVLNHWRTPLVLLLGLLVLALSVRSRQQQEVVPAMA